MRTIIRLTISDGKHSKAWFLSGNEHSKLDKAIAALDTMPDWTKISMEMVKIERTKQ